MAVVAVMVAMAVRLAAVRLAVMVRAALAVMVAPVLMHMWGDYSVAKLLL
jgi:hypothetical protein